MAKYRKKPIPVEAVQFFPDILPWPVGVYFREWDNPSRVKGESFKAQGFFIDTLNGPVMISSGEWIITGALGERYPCKPDVFDRTYEPAE